MQNPKSCTSPMPKEFSFKDLSFTVNSKGSNRKTIIQNVSNKIKSGQMVAVMGPSGSGKVCFLYFDWCDRYVSLIVIDDLKTFVDLLTLDNTHEYSSTQS